QSVDVDWHVLPLAGQPELAPGANVLLRAARVFGMPTRSLPASEALGAKNPVELLHRYLRERIVLVHHDAEAGIPTRDVVGAGCHRHLDGVAIRVALKQKQLVERELSTNPDVAHPEDEGRHRSHRRLQVVVELRAGVKLAEGFLPVVTQIAI